MELSFGYHLLHCAMAGEKCGGLTLNHSDLTTPF